MADGNDGADKTEKPTLKRLRDARRKGDVARSKDVAPAIGMLMWLVLLLFATRMVGDRVIALIREAIRLAFALPFADSAPLLGHASMMVLLGASLLVLLPAAAVGLASEFLQVGALVTTDKLKPSLDRLNPADGLKRMFGLDNLFELAKTVIKAALVLIIAWFILMQSAAELAGLVRIADWQPSGQWGDRMAAAVLELLHGLSVRLLGWTCAVFLLVAAADHAFQRHRFEKKLRMSRRDIRQEHKDNEGDPMLRSQRRQLHEEWANQNAIGAAARANVLVVNPTHLAIALDYDPADCPVPMIAGRGEGPLARAMRAAAEAEGVPIVRNVGLARSLWAEGQLNGPIPRETFDAIAEIILWARRARDGREPRLREDRP
jgi:flagellar biosynthesis protein FlhB